MGSNEYKIEPLGTDNYAEWSQRMKFLLRLKKCWHAIEASELASEDEEEKAHTLIGLNVKSIHLATISAAENAQEAWETLEKLFKSKSKARQLQLWRQLNTLKKEPQETISDYVARAKVLQEELMKIGQAVEEEKMVMILLAGLPKQYEVAVSVLTLGEADLEVDDVLAKLLHEEQRIKEADGEEATAMISKNQEDKGRKPWLKNKQWQKRDKRNDKCHYCGKKGHHIRECWRKKEDEGRDAHSEGRRASSSFAAAFTAAQVNNQDRWWLLDSGATDHITPHQSNFEHYRKVSKSVTIGDGKRLDAIGIGDVKFCSEVNGRLVEIKLQNVLHVPDMKLNLLSVGKFMDGGATLIFKRDKCKIIHRGVVIAIAWREGHGMCRVKQEVNTTAAHVAAAKETAELWHQRFAHLSYDTLEKMQRIGAVKGMKIKSEDFKQVEEKCEACIEAKHAKQPFPASTSKTGTQLELIHMDLCGPMQVKSLGGASYFATFLDDYSKLSIVRPLAHKSDAVESIKEVFGMLENQTHKKVQRVRTDRGREFVNEKMDGYFRAKGIIHETTAPYNPQQNGAAERLNRTLVEKVRAMVQDSGLEKKLWAEALLTANYARNRSLVSGAQKTPWEMFYGEVPDVSQLKTFGAQAFVYVPQQNRRKLDPRSRACIFLGYEPHSKAYRVMLKENGKIVVSRDVVVLEARGSNKAVGNETNGDDAPFVISDDEDANNNNEQQEEREGGCSSEDDNNNNQNFEAEDEEAPQQETTQEPRRNPARTTRRPPQEMYTPVANVVEASVDEPQTIQEALSSPAASMWKQAMDEEMQQLYTNKTWTLQELPKGAEPIPCKWVFKIKRNERGEIERYKARLVAKGYKQVQGVDFDEVYAPVSKHASLRTLLSVVAVEDLELHQLDVKTAFLNGELEEELYMMQPDGYEQGNKNIVCRLHKALYGLRQAPRAWHSKLKHELRSYGFVPSEADPGLWILRYNDRSIYVLVYVDDLLIAAKSVDNVSCVKRMLCTAFDARDLGEARYFIGMEIQRDRGMKAIKVSQQKYAEDIVKKFGMDTAKAAATPANIAVKLTKEGEPLDTHVHPYSELIGGLLYLSVCTRPDIAQAVGALARYMAAPTQQHWDAAKQILRYVHGTAKYGINFGENSGLKGYCDSDYAGDIDSRRSTSGFVFTLNGGAISWSSRLQPTVAASTTEAEYMAAGYAVKEALWLKKLLIDFGMKLNTISIMCDNQGAIKLLKNAIASMRSKHIDVIHHFVRERVARGEVCFEYCKSEENAADCLTKALSVGKFDGCRNNIGLHV